jgi:hypothetical protein
MCDGCLVDVFGWGGLAARHPHEVYGLIRGGSGESRVGGGDVRSSGDTPCPRPKSSEILARVRGCRGVRSAPRVVPVAGTQIPGGTSYSPRGTLR